MEYSKKKLIELALNAIKAKNLLFVDNIFAFVPYCRTTFYKHGLHKTDTIKNEIEMNRVKTKHNLHAKWYNSDNPTLQIALYKLIANEDELSRLTGSNIKASLSVSGFDSMTKEEIEEELKDVYTGR